MKRLLLGIALLLWIPMQSLALIECDCVDSYCTCFVQIGDDGEPVKAIRGFLFQQGYLESEKGGAFDRRVYEAVCRFQADNALEETGLLDDTTLTLLIHGLTPEEMDMQDENGGQLVYVPTDGGKKRHAKPTCSGMSDPRKVSVRNAEAMGMDACGRKGCNPP